MFEKLKDQSGEKATVSHGLTSIINGVTKGAKEPIHPYSIMAVVVTVCSMMNGVIASTHYRP